MPVNSALKRSRDGAERRVVQKAFENLSPIKWALAALLTGLVIQVSQANALGGWSGLIAVGEDSPIREVIAAQLPGMIFTEADGHDGQIIYAIGLDPGGEWLPDILPNPAYRYRRILLPALAGGFGLVDGEPLLISLTILVLLGFAIAAGATAVIARDRGMHPLAPLAVALNPGLWLALHITTSDTVAFALGMVGLALFLRNHHIGAIAALAGASLAKEPYVLFAIFIATYILWSRSDWRLALKYSIALAPTIAWWSIIALRLPNGLTSGDNLTVPFAGIAEAIPGWSLTGARDIAFLIVILVAFSGAIAIMVRRRASLWTFLMAPWIALGVISSHWVWDLGNNALRAFLPVTTLAVLGWLDRKSVERDHQASGLPELASEPST